MQRISAQRVLKIDRAHTTAALADAPIVCSMPGMSIQRSTSFTGVADGAGWSSETMCPSTSRSRIARQDGSMISTHMLQEANQRVQCQISTCQNSIHRQHTKAICLQSSTLKRFGGGWFGMAIAVTVVSMSWDPATVQFQMSIPNGYADNASPEQLH